eukprot:6190905-Pleurochrysis_carterae.AAC.2
MNHIDAEARLLKGVPCVCKSRSHAGSTAVSIGYPIARPQRLCQPFTSVQKDNLQFQTLSNQELQALAQV